MKDVQDALLELEEAIIACDSVETESTMSNESAKVLLEPRMKLSTDVFVASRRRVNLLRQQSMEKIKVEVTL